MSDPLGIVADVDGVPALTFASAARSLGTAARAAGLEVWFAPGAAVQHQGGHIERLHGAERALPCALLGHQIVVVGTGRDLRQMREPELRRIRGREIAMIFQDPMTSLNPVMRIRNQLADGMAAHGDRMSQREIDDRIFPIAYEVEFVRVYQQGR